MIEIVYNGYDDEMRHLIIRSPDYELLVVIDQLMAVRNGTPSPGAGLGHTPMPDSPNMAYDKHYVAKDGWYRIGWVW